MDPRALAQAEQLRAEIAASEYRSIAAFARALNDIVPTDYTTFYKRVDGRSEMPMRVMLAALDLLGLDYVTFVTRAMERVQPSA